MGVLALGIIGGISTLPAQAITTFGSASGTYNIPDNNATGITVPITISGQTNPILSFNSVTISGFTHTWYPDLEAYISNGTTTVQLIACNAGLCANRKLFTVPSSDLNGGNYTFADSGANWYTQGDPVPNQTYFSLQPLSAFNGASLNGTWNLIVADRQGADTGRFTQWSFDVEVAADAVPFEFSPTLGLVILGVGFGVQKGWKSWRNSKINLD